MHSQTHPPVSELVERLAAALQERGLMLVTAESCTGGMIAAACTDISGSSDWFERGWVTYSNAAKTEQLGVPASLIEEHGAVSEAVARAMASGAVAHGNGQVALSVTGVAGPTGGSTDKPVGTVWFGWTTPAGTATERCWFDGDRSAVRSAAVVHALEGLLARLKSVDAPLTGEMGTLRWIAQRDQSA